MFVFVQKQISGKLKKQNKIGISWFIKCEMFVSHSWM